MLARLLRSLGLFVLLGALISLLPAAVVRADGGAPNLAYVAGANGGIAVIDITQQKVVNTIAVPGNPAMVQLSLDGRFLYATQPALGKVALISAKTGNLVCSASVPGHPDLLAVDVNANLLFAAANDARTITAIDVKDDNCTIKQTIQVDGPVYGMGVVYLGTSTSADSGNQLWVATTSSVLVYDDVRGKQSAKIDVPAGPRYLSTPAGTAVYATTQQGTVVAIDLSTHHTLEVLSGGDYGPMDYDATTGKIYVPDKKHRQVAIINPVDANFKVPQNMPEPLEMGVRPASIAITSDGQLGFVALDGGNVAMYDIPGRTLITTIRVGGTPRFIITGVYPPALGDTPQQANTLQTIVTVAAYIVVGALLIVPIVLFRRYAKARTAAERLAQESEDDEEKEAEEDLAELESGLQKPPEQK